MDTRLEMKRTAQGFNEVYAVMFGTKVTANVLPLPEQSGA